MQSLNTVDISGTCFLAGTVRQLRELPFSQVWTPAQNRLSSNQLVFGERKPKVPSVFLASFKPKNLVPIVLYQPYAVARRPRPPGRLDGQRRAAASKAQSSRRWPGVRFFGLDTPKKGHRFQKGMTQGGNELRGSLKRNHELDVL